MLPLLCVTIASGALAQTGPVFPKSELRRGNEGWVVIEVSVAENGQVLDPTISDSSGNSHFNEAALEVARGWQFDEPEARQSRVLINFVFDEKRPRLSKKFTTRYAKVHRAIDKGRLNAAEDYLAEIRQQKKLNAFELAYSYLAEGRIAGVRGDIATQLACFRKAMLKQGHWVTDETYERLLYATVILGLKQKDLASAVRDYDVLAGLESGRTQDSAVAGTIEAARQYLASTGNNAAPFMATNRVVDVVEKTPRNLEDYDVYTDAGSGWTLSSDRADTPPANN